MQTYDRTDKSPEPKCAQCGNRKPEAGFTTKDVIHRGRVNNKPAVVKTTFTVCSGTPCGGHLQMAHEG